MRGLVQGIIDRSIEFADAAGGVQQGLLLYYMAVTTQDAEAASFALDYMRDRAKRPAIRSWPGPVARYYLREIDFAEVLNAATGVADVQRAVDIARGKLLSRRRLCVALFHDGVRSRTQGAEDQCLARMRECYDLEDPLLEPEWYLARYEVGRSGEVATAR
jgi:hypothetical protein